MSYVRPACCVFAQKLLHDVVGLIQPPRHHVDSPDMASGDRAPRPSTPLLVVIGVTSIALGYLGSVLGPTLIANHPATLLAIDSRSRHLVLAVAVGISPWVYAVLATARLVFADPAFFILGRRHGDDLPAILQRRLPMVATSLPVAARLMSRVGPLAVFLAPNAAISALAGMSGMRTRRFAAMNLLGTVTRLVILWWLAHRFEDTALAVASWTSSNRVILATLAAFVVVTQVARSLKLRRPAVPAQTSAPANRHRLP